jgi:hypothetical protein
VFVGVFVEVGVLVAVSVSVGVCVGVGVFVGSQLASTGFVLLEGVFVGLFVLLVGGHVASIVGVSVNGIHCPLYLTVPGGHCFPAASGEPPKRVAHNAATADTIADPTNVRRVNNFMRFLLVVSYNQCSVEDSNPCNFGVDEARYHYVNRA